MVSEALDFRYLLLENYKKLNISENELATILVIDHLINQGNPFITADLLSLRMTLKPKEIDSILAVLLTRGFLEYVLNGSKAVTTLEPLKKKLYREFQISLTKEDESNRSEKVEQELTNIFAEFDKQLGRPLSPVEISKIREWVSYGYSDETIINALKESLSRGKKSIRSVDKLLLEWSTREDIETEGHSSIRPGWNKNLEETIRIARTPWLDIDDNKK